MCFKNGEQGSIYRVNSEASLLMIPICATPRDLYSQQRRGCVSARVYLITILKETIGVSKRHELNHTM